MKAPAQSTEGFSLVELLIVLFIVTLIGAIMVPALVQSGGLLSSDLRNNARALQGMLQAARIYAGTHRVDTAVAYMVNEVEDTYWEECGLEASVPVLDGMMLVRRANEIEQEDIEEALLEALNASGCPGEFDAFVDFINYNEELYVPVQNRFGRLRQFDRDACVLADVFLEEALFPPDHVDVSILEKSGWPSLQGLVPIRIYDLFSFVKPTLLEPRSGELGYKHDTAPDDPEDPCSKYNFRFPAHVFSSSGMVRSNSARARFRLEVGLLPSADLEERFVEELPNDCESNPLPEERSVTLELYATIGRVNLEL